METEFSFIWYKKLKTGNTSFYTAPFRTKIKAKTKEEAREKLTKLVNENMKLYIVDEKDFDTTNIGNIQKSFEDINRHMDKTFKNMESTMDRTFKKVGGVFEKLANIFE